jgi:hypothetical protein
MPAMTSVENDHVQFPPFALFREIRRPRCRADGQQEIIGIWILDQLCCLDRPGEPERELYGGG